MVSSWIFYVESKSRKEQMFERGVREVFDKLSGGYDEFFSQYHIMLNCMLFME